MPFFVARASPRLGYASLLERLVLRHCGDPPLPANIAACMPEACAVSHCPTRPRGSRLEWGRLPDWAIGTLSLRPSCTFCFRTLTVWGCVASGGPSASRAQARSRVAGHFHTSGVRHDRMLHTRLTAASLSRACVVAQPAWWTSVAANVVAGHLGNVLGSMAVSDHTRVLTSLWLSKPEAFDKFVSQMLVERMVADRRPGEASRRRKDSSWRVPPIGGSGVAPVGNLRRLQLPALVGL